MFCAGSRVDHAPEYPALSRTVIEPPLVGAAVDDGDEDDEVEDEVGLELPVEDEDELLHAAAARVSAAAPAMQAVRFDLSRKLTAFTYS